MIGSELKIILLENRAYLTPDKPLTLEQAGIPSLVKFFSSPAYLVIKVKNYIKENKEIFCDIVSYEVGETKYEYQQQQISNQLGEIQIVKFRDSNTPAFMRISKSAIPVSISPPKAENVHRKNNLYQGNTHISKPEIPTINETFSVFIKDIYFKDGGVVFKKKFYGYAKAIEITISNPDIREEYDAIKNYFTNVLQTKKIIVNVCLELSVTKIISAKANSPEIDKIDKQLIEKVKIEFLRSTLKRKSRLEIEQNMFTMDEYFETVVSEEFRSDTFYNDEMDFFEDLMKISESKHYKHLRFLSSKHAHDITKLRLSLNPFSFIFLIKGDKNYHVIWETLDREEATYVWHISTNNFSITDTISKIEAILGLIKAEGKKSYIINTEDSFCRINHYYADKNYDGFLKWKAELEIALF